MQYLLDTNICIYIIKKKPIVVLKKFMEFDIGQICISSVTYAELMYGIEKSQYPEKNRSALEQFTVPLKIVPFEEKAACCYGQMRAQLERSGLPIGALDLMIAAHAYCLNAVLVTNNVKEFSRLSQLKIENWVF